MDAYQFEEIWLKGSAAMRLSAKRHRGEWGVWLELCRATEGMEKIIPTKGAQKYEWSDKLVFKLSGKDLSRIGCRLEAPQKGILVELFHYYGEKKKQLQIAMDAPERFFIKAQETPGPAAAAPSKVVEIGRVVSVLLDQSDIWALKVCISLGYRGMICHTKNGFEEPIK
jgi:hypothetical protein